MLKKGFKYFLANPEEIVCVGLLISIFGILLVHIIGRYLFGRPIAWSEEVARYFFVWITFVGASSVLKHRGHVSVEYFASFLPVKMRAYLKLAIDIAIFVFLVLLGRVGVELVERTYTIETAALGWSWSYVYGALPVGCLFMLITLTRLIWQDLRLIISGKHDQVSTLTGF